MSKKSIMNRETGPRGRYVNETDEEYEAYLTSLRELESCDWEVVEEPKKDLSYKIQQFNVNKLNVEVIDIHDVREALKEFIYSLRQLEDGYVHRKAKEIFGEELIKNE